MFRITPVCQSPVQPLLGSCRQHRRFVPVHIGVICLGLVPSQVWAQPSAQVFQLTSGNVFDISPAVDGTTYVWRRGTGSFSQIYKWTEGEPSPTLISTTTKESYPRIDDGRGVWESSAGSGGDYEVILWQNGVTSPYTTNTTDDRTPDVGGFGLVWQYTTLWLNYEDGVNQTQLTADVFGFDEHPRVVNDTVVWDASVDGTSSGKEIFYWHAGSLSQLTSNTYFDGYPETDGTTVVWFAANGPGGSQEIMRWTAEEGTVQLTSNAVYDTQPDVSGDVVVFSRDDGNDYEIFFRYLGVDYQITNNSFNDSEPAIKGDRVVWEAQAGDSVRHIYYAIISGLGGGDIPGACCSGLECSVLTESDCQKIAGLFMGTETFCKLDTCPAFIQPASNWSTLQHDARRTGRTTAVVPDSPVRIWSLLSGTPPFIPPVIGPDGTIYVSSDDSLVALSPDGSLAWSSPYAPRHSGAVRADGNLFVPSVNSLNKLDHKDGTSLCGIGNFTEFAVLLEPGGHCVYCTDSFCRRLDPGCQEDWTYNATITSHPAVGQDGGIYVAGSSSLIKLDPETGIPSWVLPTSGSPGPPSIAEDGKVYVTVWPDMLVAVNPDGTEHWSSNLPDYLVAAGVPVALAEDGTIYTAGEVPLTNDRLLVAVNSSGHELWRFVEPDSGTPLAPVVTGDGTILFALRAADLIAVATDGSEAWRVSLESDTFSSAPAVGDNGTIYITTDNGYLVAIGSGCPEPDPASPPFDYRLVAEVGDVLGGYTILDFEDIEIYDDGRVIFLARANPFNELATFIEQTDGTFQVIGRGARYAGFEVDMVSMARRDQDGNLFVAIQTTQFGPAILFNDLVVVAEDPVANPLVLVDPIHPWNYFDHNDSGRLVFLGSGLPTLFSVDVSTGSVEPLISVNDVVDGFVIGILDPDPVDGFGDDNVPVLRAQSGVLEAIVSPGLLIAQEGVSFAGYNMLGVHSPRRNADGDVFFLGEHAAGGVHSIFRHSAESEDVVVRGAGQTVAGQPIISINAFSVNHTGDDLAYSANLLGTGGVFLNADPVAIAGISLIDASVVVATGAPTSVSDGASVAFVAQVSGSADRLYAATPQPQYDCNQNGLPDCQEVAADPTQDCTGNGKIDACDIAEGKVADVNRNGIPDDCECLTDLNGDLSINASDLALLLGAWGPNPGHPADVNTDGQVNAADLALLLGSWGAC